MPDSIIMNMTDRSFLPPGRVPMDFSFEVGLTCWYTAKILRTIKPVARALTTKDRTRLVKNIVLPQLVGVAIPEDEKYHELLFVNQMPRSNSVSELRFKMLG